jgi:FixJ family two-component response regulator
MIIGEGLKSRQIPLYAGVRSEMDREFIRIINSLSEETNLNEFIKSAVVELHRRKKDLSDIEDLKTRLGQLEAKNRELEHRIQSGISINNEEAPVKEVAEEVKVKEVENKVKSMRNAFNW